MLRKAAVAGRFYPAGKEEITRFISNAVDKGVTPYEAVGAVLPHAGYMFSGEVAVATASRIKLTPTVVVIGPNHTGIGRPFAIMTQGSWQTPLGEVPVDSGLAKHILNLSRYLEEDSVAHQHEHSIEVQLPILQYFKPDIKFVPISLAGAGLTAYNEIGWAIAKAVRSSQEPVVIIASSDMTHYEPHDAAKKKDLSVVDAILEMDEVEMLKAVREHNVSMCGSGPVACLIRSARELGAGEAELVQYRTSGDAIGDYSSVVGYAGIIIRSKDFHPLVRLAKNAVETFVRERRIIKPPEEASAEMKERAGVFVSLHKGRELRGCIGTFSPAQMSVAEEVIINAVHAATEDPRFSPVSSHELSDISYSVDVLSEPEPVDDESMLDPVKYGVIVESGHNRGLLLPDLEGVDTVQKQIEICRMKAGISPDEPVKLYRFKVRRYR